MATPWLVVALGVVAILVITRFAAVLMNVVGERAIGSKHRAAQHIVETGRIPPQWLEAKARAAGATTDVQDVARRAAIEKLDALIAHFTTSPLVEDEETRQLLLGQLNQAHTAWRERPWHEIT